MQSSVPAIDTFYGSKFSPFYPTAIHGSVGIVFILAGRVAGRAAAATLSRLDLCDYKLEEILGIHIPSMV